MKPKSNEIMAENKNYFLSLSSESMSKEDIIARLRNGDKFTGQNGAFRGIMTPIELSDDAMTMKVHLNNCNGMEWEETWNDNIYTIYGFQTGDYRFI
jgi:hypothetical protein